MNAKTLIIPLAALTLLAHAETYRYQDTVEGDTYTTTIEVEPSSDGVGYLITANDEYRKAHHVILTNSRMEGIEWRMESDRGDSLNVTRRENALEATGTLNGKAVSETRFIDEKPWFPSLELGLTGLIRQGLRGGEFWVLSPKDLKTITMIAKIRDPKKTAQGARGEALAAEISVSGVPSLFFSMDFLMRKEDGIRIQYEGKAGGPGSPKIRSELIEGEH